MTVEVGEFEAQIRERRAEQDGLAQLVLRIGDHADIGVGLRDFSVQVRDLSLHERVELAGRIGAACERVLIDLARVLVEPEVVVRDRKIERGLGVASVDRERFFERRLGLFEVTAVVMNHAHHVENVCEAVGSLKHLTQERLGFFKLPLIVVFATQRQELLRTFVHVCVRE